MTRIDRVITGGKWIAGYSAVAAALTLATGEVFTTKAFIVSALTSLGLAMGATGVRLLTRTTNGKDTK